VAYVTTQAISLRCINYSETSQVVMLITPDMGQVHVLAKGARKPGKDPKKRPWDELIHYDCVLSRRAAGTLHLATEWSQRESFPVLSEDMSSFWTGFYAADAVVACTTETPEDGAAFYCLNDLLHDLQEGKDPLAARFRFLVRLLALAGCAPVSDRCAQCGRALQEGTRFSSRAGGALCGDCGRADPEAFTISRGALAVLRGLAEGEGGAPRIRVTAEQGVEIQRAFNEQIQYHLGRPLRTERFLGGCTQLQRRSGDRAGDSSLNEKTLR